MMPSFELPNFSVVVWVKESGHFNELELNIISLAAEPPYSATKYQGMADFHFGFNDIVEARQFAQKLEPIAQHSDVMLLEIMSRIDGVASVTIKDQRQTKQNVGRNDPCPCGSGKKFKKCCLH
jgi:hypothetical protein